MSNVLTDQKSLRQNILPDTSFLGDQRNNTRNQNTSHRFNFRIDYRPDSLTSIRFTPSITLQNYSYSSLMDAITYNGSYDPLNQSTTSNTSAGNGLNGSSNLLFMRKFNIVGRTFSVNLNTQLNRQQTDATNLSSTDFLMLLPVSLLPETLTRACRTWQAGI